MSPRMHCALMWTLATSHEMRRHGRPINTFYPSHFKKNLSWELRVATRSMSGALLPTGNLPLPQRMILLECKSQRRGNCGIFVSSVECTTSYSLKNKLSPAPLNWPLYPPARGPEHGHWSAPPSRLPRYPTGRALPRTWNQRDATK